MAASFRKRNSNRLGSVFGESLNKNTSYVSNYAGKSMPHRSVVGRIILLSVFVIGFLVLAGRVMYLTVAKGSYYRELSRDNRIRQEQIPPSRGILYSSDGSVLAANRPIYKQCDELGMSCQYLERDDALAQEAEGEEIIVELGREYPENAAVSHLIGYMSEVTADQLDDRNNTFRNLANIGTEDYCQNCYLLGEYVGASGVEETFESTLRGTPGKRLVEVDSSGVESRELARVEPVSGENVTLSVDLSLQKAGIASLEKTLEKTGDAGAIVAINPKSGEILALYSAPSFDPNLFVFIDPTEIEDFIRDGSKSNSDTNSFSNTSAAAIVSAGSNIPEELSYTNTTLDEVLTDSKRPLFNRTISGLYSPASTFKIITATAGLEEGVLDEQTTVEDTGVLQVGEFSFGNWYFSQYGRTEGEISIERALARSNDIFFYKVGEWLGIENLEKWAKQYGLSVKTGIELSGEEEGIVRREREWYLGDTYHVAIGQGDLLTTPIQVASWTQAIANDGNKCKPTVLSINNDQAECDQLPIHDDTLQLVQNGLIRACASGGTAYPLFDFSVNTASSSASTREFDHDESNYISLENNGTKIVVACKTGTGEFGDPKDRTHAWLTAYAPAEDPEIVITVLVEAGGEGSKVAAPIVKDMLSEWFSKER